MKLAGRWLLGGAAVALAACLAAPTLPLEQARFEQVIVLDVTQSMNVADMQIGGRPASRIAYARHVLREALAKLPCGSKVGWAIFTEYRAYLLNAPIEVCAHLGELRATLERIDGRMAWSGNSEVAKGLHSALVVAKALPGRPSVVFVTDGHEAPPLNPRFRPAFDDKAGEVSGLIVGVGGDRPLPIPKTDPEGRPLGFWSADDVMQTDPRSQGRGGSVGGEAMADDDRAAAPAAAALGAAPGSEHLSALHEGYLRLLAGELGLGFARLDDAAAFERALTAAPMARPVQVAVDARPALAAVALGLLLARYLTPLAAGWRARHRRRTHAA